MATTIRVDSIGITCFGVDFPICRCSAAICPDFDTCKARFETTFAAELTHWMRTTQADMVLETALHALSTDATTL